MQSNWERLKIYCSRGLLRACTVSLVLICRQQMMLTCLIFPNIYFDVVSARDSKMCLYEIMVQCVRMGQPH